MSKSRLFATVYYREKYQKESFPKINSGEKFPKGSFGKVYAQNFAIFSLAKVSSFKVGSTQHLRWSSL